MYSAAVEDEAFVAVSSDAMAELRTLVNLSCVAITEIGTFTLDTSIIILHKPLPSFADAVYTMPKGEQISPVTPLGFSLTTQGNRSLQLVAVDEFLSGIFFEGSLEELVLAVKVEVGGVEAEVEVPEDDMGVSFHKLRVILPPYDAVCLVDGVDACATAYTSQPLKIFYEGYVASLDRVWEKEIACPPQCPGGNGEGIIYSLQCEGYETGNICFDPEHASECAFGSGVHCRSCPEGAICPGGFRAWPLPSYWSASPNDPNVVLCKPPASARCLGFKAGNSKGSLCGPGYNQASYMCLGCDEGYYAADGLCLKCPEEESLLSSAITPLLGLGGFLGGVFLASCGVLYGALKKANLPRSPFIVASIAFDFLFWQIVVLQSLAQLARNSVPGLPSAVRGLFNFFQLFQLDVDGVSPPACASGYFFLRPVLVLCGGLALCGLFYVVGIINACCSTRRHTSILSWIQYLSGSGICFGYALVTNSAFQYLNCVSDDRSNLVLFVQPMIHCYEAEHYPVAVLSWLVIAAITVGLPLVLLLGGRRVAIRSLRRHHSSNRWFKVNKLEHKRLREVKSWLPVFTYGQTWFRATFLLYLATLSLVGQVFEARNDYIVRGAMECGISLGYGLFVFFTKPDYEWTVWKRVPRFLVFIATAMTGIMQVILAVEGASFDHRASSQIGQPIEPWTLSESAVVACWTCVVVALLLPLVLFWSFTRWVLQMVGLCGRNIFKLEGNPGHKTHRHALFARFLVEHGERTQSVLEEAEQEERNMVSEDVEVKPKEVELTKQEIFQYNPLLVLRGEFQGSLENPEEFKAYSEEWHSSLQLEDYEPQQEDYEPQQEEYWPQQEEEDYWPQQEERDNWPQQEERDYWPQQEERDYRSHQECEGIEEDSEEQARPQWSRGATSVELVDGSAEARSKLLGTRQNRLVLQYVNAVSQLHGKKAVIRRGDQRD